MNPVQLLVGLALAIGIAAFARWRRSLTTGGAACAIVVGTLVFGLGGVAPGAALIGFFIASTALSKWRKSEKERAGGDVVEKGGVRDALQVLANGGAAALFCLIWATGGGPAQLVGAIGALAAANADTWSTEIGMLAQQPPRHLLTLQRVPAGTSGAVSVAGLGAMLAGALFVALLALPAPTGAMRTALSVFLGGVIGAMSDSLLGATVQERRHCAKCDKETEQRTHRCGTRTRRIGGIRGCDNDVVNALSTLIGGGAASLVYWLAR